MGAEYCDQPVCLSVCLFVYEHISGIAGPIGTKFCVRIPNGRGSVLFWQRCAMLCTSGFIDDVTFGRRLRLMGATKEYVSRRRRQEWKLTGQQATRRGI